jgi:hypothetical protein
MTKETNSLKIACSKSPVELTIIDSNGKTVWKCTGPFVSLAEGSTNQVTGSGHFNLETTITRATKTQTIDSFTLSNDDRDLSAKGMLDGQIGYSLSARISDDGRSASFTVEVDGEAKNEDRVLLKFDSTPDERIFGLVY